MVVQFDCCGYDSYEDWLGTDYLNSTQLFPDSCNCTNTSAVECTTVTEVPQQMIYNQNCSVGVSAFLQENLLTIGAVGITFGVIQVGVVHKFV